MYTDSRESQSWNAPSPIDVTLSGIVILVRLMQLKNAESAMLVTLFGIVMFLRS